MKNICKNIEEYNPYMKLTTLILFDDMIADMLSNKKLNVNSNISLVFITQSYLAVPKMIRLHSANYFVMKTKENFNNCI